WDAHVLWDGGQVRMDRLEWERDDSEGSGELTLQLQRAEPSYRLTGEVRNFRWKGGAVDGEVELTSSGNGAALLRNARSLGRFTARELVFPAESEIRTAAGKYEISASRGAALLKLDALEVSGGGDVYTGRGASEADGKLTLDLSSGRKKLHL